MSSISDKISVHKENIELLKKFARGEYTLANRGLYSGYKRDEEDALRLKETLLNLQVQINILEMQAKVEGKKDGLSCFSVRDSWRGK